MLFYTHIPAHNNFQCIQSIYQQMKVTLNKDGSSIILIQTKIIPKSMSHFHHWGAFFRKFSEVLYGVSEMSHFVA